MCLWHFTGIRDQEIRQSSCNVQQRPLQQRISLFKMSVVLRLRNPGIEASLFSFTWICNVPQESWLIHNAAHTQKTSSALRHRFLPGLLQELLHWSPYFILFFHYLRCDLCIWISELYRECKKDRDREEETGVDFPSVDSVPKWPEWPGPGLAKGSSQEFYPT